MKLSLRIIFIGLITLSLCAHARATSPFGNAEEAQYNHILTIEPEEPEWNLWFGYKVDIVGDQMIINEPKATVEEINTAGRIRIYNLDGDLITTIQSPEPGSNYIFGRFFDCNEDTIVTSEINDVGETKFVGRAHVYSLDGNLLFSIKPDEPTKGRYFAYKVAISEDSIFLMDRGVGMKPMDAGQVQVYDKDGEYTRTILSPNPKVQGWFGGNIKTFNDRVYISQYGESGSPVGPGYVYVFDNEGNSVITLESPTPEELAIFGFSVSISSEYIVVGEPWATVEDTFRAGKAYIFNHEGEHLQTLQAPETEVNAQFGFNVKVSGETVVVGEMNSDIKPSGNEGKAYVFNVGGGLLQTLNAPDPSPKGAFGYSIDIKGDLLAISESWAEVEGTIQCGKVYLYKLGAPVETQEPVEKETPVSDDDSEPSGGIPGFPIGALVVGLVLSTIIYIKRKP